MLYLYSETVLADTAGFSPSHLHRLFRATVGVTPKQYAMTRRMHQVQERLQQDPTVTEAMYNAGFVSSSCFSSIVSLPSV